MRKRDNSIVENVDFTRLSEILIFEKTGNGITK